MHIIQSILEWIIDTIFKFLPQNSSQKIPLIVAHRGWHQDGITENTIKSFQKAKDSGLWGIEFDIRWTRDLVPVIHHDPHLLRIWQKNILISDLDFHELRNLVPEIPSLEEVVHHFGKKIHLFVEIKQEKFPQLRKQCAILENILKPLDPVADFHLMALDVSLFKKFDLYTNKKVYVLVSIMNPLTIQRQAIDFKCGAVTGHYLLISKSIQRKLYTFDVEVGTGFIKSQNSLKRELARGAKWIFTNHPKNLIKE